MALTAVDRWPSRMRRAVLGLPAAWLMHAGRHATAGVTTSTEWIGLDVGAGLSLQVPRGSRFLRSSGVDSLSGSVSGPGFDLDLDYGAFSDPLASFDAFSKVEASEALIDGRPARIVFATLIRPARNRPYFFGMHVPAAAPGAPDSLKLTVTAHLRQRSDLILIRRIVDTFRFKPQQ